ncbi:MAG: hypothetical protein KC609_03815, partial [Myxococcales bacterium]|nr:hypothetical protein [Myxococcales bacterium]
RYPGSQISVVAPESHAPLVRELSFIEHVYPVPGDLVRFLTSSRSFIWQLRRQQFDLAVISAEADDPEEQIDLEFLALAFGAAKTTYLSPEYVEVAVSFKHALRGFVHRHETLTRATERLPRVLQNYFRRDL